MNNVFRKYIAMVVLIVLSISCRTVTSLTSNDTTPVSQADPDATEAVPSEPAFSHPVEKISENPESVTQLAVFGKGALDEVVYSKSGEVFGLATSLGIYIYDASSFKDILFIETDSWVTHISLSPDGEKVAGNIDGGFVKVWDAKTGAELFTVTLQSYGYINAFTISPDGQYLVTPALEINHTGPADGGSNLGPVGSIAFWDMSSGELVEIKKGDLNGNEYAGLQMVDIAYSPDGTQFVSSFFEGPISIWDSNEGTIIETWDGLYETVDTIYSPDGTLMASGNKRGEITIWDASSREVLATLDAHTDEIRTVAFSPDSKILASGSKDMSVKLWNVATGELLQEFTESTKAIWNIAFTPPGDQLLVSTLVDLSLLDVSGNSIAKEIEKGVGYASILVASPTNDQFAGGFTDSAIRIWDLNTREIIKTLVGHEDKISYLAYSPDGSQLVSSSSDKTIKIWDLETGNAFITIQVDPWVGDLVYLPGGDQLAGAVADKIQIWDTQTGELVHLFQAHEAAIYSLAVSPHGDLLASGSRDGTIKLWEIGTWSEKNTLISEFPFPGQVFSLAFSPNGQFLASGADVGMTSIWDVETGVQNTPLQFGNGTAIYSVVYSPDGKVLVSGSGNSEKGPIIIWNPETNESVQTLDGHTNDLNALTFTNDGLYLISAGSDQTIRVWGVP